MNLTQARKQISDVLNACAYDMDEARALSLILLEEVTKRDRTHLLLPGKDTLLTEAEAERLAYLLDRMVAGMPIQYAIGRCPFGELELEVSAGVLIPRPETEELCALIIERESTRYPAIEPKRILDIGCGSGCIAISLASALPQDYVYAFDASEIAVATTRQNASRIIPDRIRVFRADIFDQKTYKPHLPTRLDIIVSNPPYIQPSEHRGMAAHVLDYEPHEALFAPEEDPLIFYRQISNLAQQYLPIGGRLYFEINAALSLETRSLTAEILGDDNAELIDDCFGRPRFVCAVKR